MKPEGLIMEKTILNRINPYMERSLFADNKNSVIGVGLITRTDKQDFFINDCRDYFRFVIFLEGEGLLVREGTDIIKLNSPCAFPLKKNEYYSILPSPDSTWTEFCIRIDYDVIESLIKMGLIPPLTGLIPISSNPHFIQWMTELSGQIRKMPSEFLPELFFDLQRFLIAFCHSGEKGMNLSYYYPMIAEAKQMLKDSVPDGTVMNTRMLADYFHISSAHFTKVFKYFTGTTPAQYLMHFKIHYAERLLENGLSVKETAGRIGYADPFIFSKQFKKITGRSPRELRRDNLS